MHKRTEYLMWIVLAALSVALIIVGLSCAGPAMTDPSPSPAPSSTTTVKPSPSPSAIPLPPAPSASLKRWVRHWHSADLRAFRLLRRARACSAQCAPKRPAALPRPIWAATAWKQAGAQFKAQTKRYRCQFKRLRHKMLHPGGSSNGVRWTSLARWVGWPKRALHTLAGVIMNESSGRQNAHNPSGASGLLQLMPCWWAGKFNPYDPEANLREGLSIWRGEGGSFEPAWSGDGAVP